MSESLAERPYSYTEVPSPSSEQAVRQPAVTIEQLVLDGVESAIRNCSSRRKTEELEAYYDDLYQRHGGDPGHVHRFFKKDS